MTAYYNEIDPAAAQWLRNLIAAGHIAPGDVDERSIEDVHPEDIKRYTQCHFFAGIGVWSYALRRAGFPDDRPIWTGSCPCQPFSSAGKGSGFSDERHLWPAFHHLIRERRPAAVIGEQVASKDAEPWIDLVQADLEALGYAFAAVPFPSASVGAPHIRDRLYWMGDANKPGLERHSRLVGDARRQGEAGSAATPSIFGGMADTNCDGRHQAGQCQSEAGRDGAFGDGFAFEGSAAASPLNGFWRDADWLFCRDGKWRPVEPGYEQMADGSASSLGRVCSEVIQEIEGELDDWANRHQADAGEALHRVWSALQSEALCEREAGRFSGVQSPSVLLAFLRQLTDQGWRFAVSLACAGEEASSCVVRVMQFDASAARTPLRRELAEQFTGQLADPMRELSSIVAHHATKCWGDACRAKAGAASFPLMGTTPARVVRLRAYGNAINAEQARIFIEAGLMA